MSKVDITLNNVEMVGSINFTQPFAVFGVNRTASGFRLHIPALITFRPPQASQNPLILENVEVTFFASGNSGEIEIGTARYTEPLTSGPFERPVTFVWEWTLSALAVYERIRDGAEPQFRLSVSGNIRFLFPLVQHHQVSSTASPFRSQTNVRYSREAWTKTLRDLNVRESVILEIPYPADPPNGWEPIWQSLRDARDSFDTGGSTGWKSCITSVRHALEQWQQIEKENQGPGWQRPSIADLQSRTKEQRIDAVRWHLMQVAHYAAHTRADEWTRDDALLALSTICALLGLRKP